MRWICPFPLLIGLLIICNTFYCQKKFTLNIGITLGSSSSFLGEKTALNEETFVRIDQCKFYLSSLEFLQNGKIVHQIVDSFYLIDLTDSASQTIHLHLPKNLSFDNFRCNLGIDSITNVSGAMGGALDPTLGMYWTWQSGYINFKLEGEIISNDKSTELSFHLGGYSGQNNAIQIIQQRILDPNQLNLVLDLGKFLDLLDLTENQHIMSPGLEAVERSQQLATCFYYRK